MEGTRFVFHVEQALLEGQPVPVPPRVALGWYRDFDGDALLASPPRDLWAGQRWRLVARLRQPHGTLNPQGFDLELWLFEQGLRATGAVRATAAAAPQLLADAAGHPVERARQAIRDAILLRVADAQAAGVLAALAVGDQAAIDRDDWELFRDTGVAHLMSISGLHVTLFAWLAALFIGPLWRLSPALTLAVPAPTAARWGGVLAAAGYALLAGWGVPAQRTLWMLATVALLRSGGLHWPQPLVLLAAAVVVTLFDPWALLQLRRLRAAHRREPVAPPPPRAGARRWPPPRGLRTQAVASVGLAPLSLVFFQQVSLVGFIANLVAIPLVTLAIVPLTLAGVLLPPLWQPAALLVQGLGALLQWLVAWPFALWTAAAAPAWAVAAGLAGALLLMPLPWRLRLLGLPLLLPLLAPPVARPPPGAFEVVAADVGQGSALLLRTRHHLLLYDAGPRYSPQSDAGGRVLLPLLRARGEHRIDLLMLSHRDIDHVGGAASLLARTDVAAISALKDRHRCGWAASRTGAAPPIGLAVGRRAVQVHPPPGDAPASSTDALSCVLRAVGRRAAALAGDIGRLGSGAAGAPTRCATRCCSFRIMEAAPRRPGLRGGWHRPRPWRRPAATAEPGARGRGTLPGPRRAMAQRSDRCSAWT